MTTPKTPAATEDRPENDSIAERGRELGREADALDAEIHPPKPKVPPIGAMF